MRRIVKWALVALLLYIVIASAALFLMPMSASAASRPVDRACVSHLRETTDLTRRQRIRRCRVRARATVTVSAASATHATLSWWVGHEFIRVRAAFEVEKRRTFPWSPLRWQQTGSPVCWVDRSIIYSTEITSCSTRRGDGKLIADMAFAASVKVFDWGFVTKGVHSRMSIEDDGDEVEGPIVVQ
jgi:hypothetical protein